jgi:Kef-type K+ transport system membrane component KefB
MKKRPECPSPGTVGAGMVPRGEVAMIVALLGREAGIIGQGVYVAVILMTA